MLLQVLGSILSLALEINRGNGVLSADGPSALARGLVLVQYFFSHRLLMLATSLACFDLSLVHHRTIPVIIISVEVGHIYLGFVALRFLLLAVEKAKLCRLLVLLLLGLDHRRDLLLVFGQGHAFAVRLLLLLFAHLPVFAHKHEHFVLSVDLRPKLTGIHHAQFCLVLFGMLAVVRSLALTLMIHIC
jgi:hypothetical protein